LDRLAGEVAHVRQLTYNAMIAQMAIDESKSRLDSTSACYDAACQHAEKVQKSLKRATINLNLRQGQANSPDHSDFATTVVHDPADHDFMGGKPNPQERMTTKPAPSSPPLAPLIPTSLPQKPSTNPLVFYGPHNLYPKRQCCVQSTQPCPSPPPPPRPSPPLVTASAGKQLYPTNRPLDNLYQSEASRRRATNTLLDVIKHIKYLARVDVLIWCSKQSPSSLCSLQTIFRIVCASSLAEVPDKYYTARKNLERRGFETFDLDIITIEHIKRLWSN
jgi:hypothetical protein